MYFNVYVQTKVGNVFIKQLDYIDLSTNLDLYELKQRITKIEESFETWKITQPNIDGKYSLLISSKNLNPSHSI